MSRQWVCRRCYHVNGDDTGACSYCRSGHGRLFAFIVVALLIGGVAITAHRAHEIITAHQSQ